MLENTSLTSEQATGAMNEIMSGLATPAQVGAFLVALKKKRETVEEITALARVMRSYSKRIHPKVGEFLVDTCGTGGDKAKTFNISTTTALVAAAAGIPIAKHGNRSFASKCGSADVLERLGFNLSMDPQKVQDSIEEIGIGFMYAPNFHPAMKNVTQVRRDIGIRTIFNLLGPLTNPAGANAQLIGVSDLELLDTMARAALSLGATSVMTVYGLDGVDEISLTGKTAIVHATNDSFSVEEISPEDVGFKRTLPTNVSGSDPEFNARVTIEILAGRKASNDPRVQTVLLNTAATLILAKRVDRFSEGIEIAKGIIEDGLALETLRDMVEFSGGDTQRLFD